MDGVDAGGIVAIAVGSVLYASVLVVTFRRVGSRMPAAIVQRLFRTGQPVVVHVGWVNQSAWDPSRRLGHGGFFTPGTATYTLVDSATVQVRFQPRTGQVVERRGSIPTSIVPDTPGTQRRRRIARAVVALYVSVGLATFILTASLAGGSAALRSRTGAFAALCALAIAWLATHAVLTRTRRRTSASLSDPEPSRPAFTWVRHLAVWLVGLVLVSAALAVAWRLDSLTQPHPTPWASAFLDAFVFVLGTAAALAATLHHHNYVHHADHHVPPLVADPR